MMRPFWLRACFGVVVAGCLTQGAFAQTALTWQQVREKFQAANPTLQAGQIGIQESKAQEITAYLRPNPSLSVGMDQFDPFNTTPFRPLQYLFTSAEIDYLHERQHKRELRLESARKGTEIAEAHQTDLERTLLSSPLRIRNAGSLPGAEIAESQQTDLERTLLFSLRQAF